MKKTNLNKVGIYVKRNFSEALSTILGIITKYENRQSRSPANVKSIENVYSEKKLGEAFWEADLRKGKAIALIHDAQNC